MIDRLERSLVLAFLVVALTALIFGFLLGRILGRYQIVEPPEPELPEVLLTVTPPLEQSGPALTWNRRDDINTGLSPDHSSNTVTLIVRGELVGRVYCTDGSMPIAHMVGHDEAETRLW